MTNLDLSSAGRWASAGSAKSTWGPLSPAALRAAWHPNKLVMGLSKNSGLIGISNCRPLFHKNMAQTSWTVIWTLLQHRLMVCYSTLPQSLPHCLRQASDSTSGWVVLGSSSWGNPWHENGSCQVTAACLRRASLPCHEKTLKGRSLSTQPIGHQCREKHQFTAILRPLWRRWQQLCQPARSPNIHSWCWTAGHTKNRKSINFITPMGKRLSKCQRQRDWSGWSSLPHQFSAHCSTLEKENNCEDAEPVVGFSNFCPFWGAPSACCFLAASTLASSRCKWTRHRTRQRIHDPNLDALVPCLSLLLHLLWNYNRNVAMLLPIPKSPVNSWVSYGFIWSEVHIRVAPQLLLLLVFALEVEVGWGFVLPHHIRRSTLLYL